MMRPIKFSRLAVMLCLTLVPFTLALAQQPAPPASSAAPAAPAQEVQTPPQASIENIKRLMELQGATDSMKDSHKQLMAMFKQQLPQVPDTFWAALQKEFDDSKMMDELLNKIYTVYAKHLTDQEIKAMIQFYETPDGKNIAKAIPKITQEITVISADFGERLARRAIEKLKTEGQLK